MQDIGDGYNYNLALEFYRVAKQYANNIALKYVSGESFNFEKLNQRSNQYARYLFNIGLKKGDVIVIFNDKSIDAFALLLGCIKTGVIYSNIDQENPSDRLRKIISTCQAKFSFNFFESHSDKLEQLYSEEIPVISAFSNEIKKEIDEFDCDNLSESLEITGCDPIYIVFTSGSTGFPKGALMSHDNVKCFISWCIDTFNITNGDVFTNINPIYFDNSVFDIYSSLYSGACLVPFSSDIVSTPHKLVAAVEQTSCTVWFSVPSLLIYLLTTKSIKSGTLRSLRNIVFGGEGFPKTHLRKLYELFEGRAELVNVYGPTECTCICSSHTISPTDFGNMQELTTIGKIARNFNFVILDEKNHTALTGELCLSGPCVGLGYYNDSAHTEAAFVQHPLTSEFNKIIYRTGDMVEQRNDKLYFLGRKDNQIKLMGYRIELEEIESVINSLPHVNQCVVLFVAQEHYAGKIVAAITLAKEISEEGLRNMIKTKLPDYMIPKEIILLDQLPKNRNGKVDRNEVKRGYYNL